MPPLTTIKTQVLGLQQHSNYRIENLEILHSLYVKKDSSKQFPKDKTLFILNIPTDSSIEHLQELFAQNGVIDSIKFFNKSSGFGCHLIFKDKESISSILQINSKLKWPTHSLGLSSLFFINKNISTRTLFLISKFYQMS